VLYAYPAASTPGCTTQACDFRDSLSSLQARGYDVVGPVAGRADEARALPRRRGADLPAAVRPSKQVLTAYGAYGEKSLYGKTVVGVLRSTFVLDEQGVVQARRTASRPRGTSRSCAEISGWTDAERAARLVAHDAVRKTRHLVEVVRDEQRRGP
jgi:peroxiredoxin